MTNEINAVSAQLNATKAKPIPQPAPACDELIADPMSTSIMEEFNSMPAPIENIEFTSSEEAVKDIETLAELPGITEEVAGNLTSAIAPELFDKADNKIKNSYKKISITQLINNIGNEIAYPKDINSKLFDKTNEEPLKTYSKTEIIQAQAAGFVEGFKDYFSEKLDGAKQSTKDVLNGPVDFLVDTVCLDPQEAVNDLTKTVRGMADLADKSLKISFPYFENNKES